MVPPGILCIADGAAVYLTVDVTYNQDIAPKVFDNQYKNVNADDEAYVIYAYGDKVLLKEEDGEISVPKLRELSGRAFQSVYFPLTDSLFLCLISKTGKWKKRWWNIGRKSPDISYTG